MKKILQKNIWLIYEGLFLILIEIFNQLLIMKSAPIQLHSIGITFMFDVIWAIFILFILYSLKPKGYKIVTIIINSFLIIINVINHFIYLYFEKVVSWKDLILADEGVSFISSIFKYINLKLIIFIITSVILTVMAVKTRKKANKTNLIIVITCIIFLLIARFLIQRTYLSHEDDGWNSFEVINNYANNYIEWVDSPKILRASGTFEYLIRDFYISFLKKDNTTKSLKDAETYIKLHEDDYESNEYTGIYKDKNLIFVMMEALDDWLVNPKVTPTMYEMMQHGFNFTNHYSPVYVTGATANTEFIANSGMYPNINKLSPNYAFVNNSFPYSIASLFKEEGYITNSYHRSSGYIYNREKMHESLGYNKYHSYLNLDIDEENINLDSYLIKNGYNKIINNDKFMSFIITYTPHSPYNYSKEECTTHLDEIKKIYPKEKNEEILCAYAAARETDEMFKVLIEKLTADNLLGDTIIVAFSDHPNRVVIRDDETEKLNKTIFYIYDSESSSHQIDKLTSSINILPTLANLFDLNHEYVYPGYDALSNEDGYIIFDDYTYYDGTEIKKITTDMKEEIDYSINLLVSDYYHNK